MAKRDGYASEEHILAQMSGLVEGLTQQGLPTLQQGRIAPGGANVGSSLCECAINPTHCFRTVSQRSLTVANRFLSKQLSGPPNLPTQLDMFGALFASAQGCILGGSTPTIFNDANDNNQRKRIYDLVCFAMRVKVDVMLIDAEAVSAGSIDVSNLQQRLEDMAYQYFSLRIFHSADRADPWVDYTPIGYFQRPAGEFVLIPPVKWVDRDPAMELSLQPAEFGAAAGENPALIASTRNLEGTASISVETLWMPDPKICPDLWPGQICPRNKIGNTPDYNGNIMSARRTLSALTR